MDRDQRRSALIAGGVVTGVLVLLVVGITLSGGDHGKTTSVEIEHSSSTSSSSTTTPTVLTTTTLVQPLLPPVAPRTIPPGVVIVVPTSAPSAPPPVAPTAPRTTPPTPPTTSTTRPHEIVTLETKLEAVLNGGTQPDAGSPKRVRVVAPPAAPIQVTWTLDPTLSTTAQKTAVRAEAFSLLEAIQSAHLSGQEPIVLRATLPDPATGTPKRVVRLRFERATLETIDFATTDPQRIFSLANQRQVDPSLKVVGPPTTTTTATP